MNIAYLVSRYPAVSHTFIQREVVALRKLGHGVHTFSIRRVSSSEVLSNEDRNEQAATVSLLPTNVWRLAWSHVVTFARGPRRYLAALGLALSIRAPGIRSLLWRMFYFAEAGLLARQLRSRGVEHLHTHFANVASDVGMLATTMLGIRWSMTLHGLSDFGNPETSRLGDKIRCAALVICVSDFGRAQAMLHSPPECWDGIHVIRCGLEMKGFAESATQAAPTETGPLRLLTVGRLAPEKGYRLLLVALRQVIDRGIECGCTFVGDGPDRAALERLAAKLEIEKSVRFAGAVGQDKIGSYYAEADAFVMASFAEGLPVVLVEAMACGIPVIAPRIMGIPELVENGVHGILVSPGRASSIAEAIGELAMNPDRRRRMGELARERVAHDFEIGNTAAQLATLLQVVATPECESVALGITRSIKAART